ncbi:MAG: hypothetical protein D6690_14565 [Nitrospirae bacterium]|nr:MAG: hypothetical protein D6690_14565 [Nitrospirota bacterium]
MRRILIPKSHRTWRTIYVPGPAEKARLRGLVPVLHRLERSAAERHGTIHVAHGFVPHRSPVTCALAHLNCAWTLTADLADWFDHIHESQIAHGIELGGGDPNVAAQLCVDGAPQQGLPTSPIAANLAAIPMDRWILDRLPPDAVYTRYADDLQLSLRTAPHDPQAIVGILEEAASHMGWQIAPHKTRIYDARRGHRIIVGIAVGSRSIAIPRTTRRRLRAARHQRPQHPHTQGLEEWCRLLLPRALRPRRRLRFEQATDTPPAGLSSLSTPSSRISHAGTIERSQQHKPGLRRVFRFSVRNQSSP